MGIVPNVRLVSITPVPDARASLHRISKDTRPKFPTRYWSPSTPQKNRRPSRTSYRTSDSHFPSAIPIPRKHAIGTRTHCIARATMSANATTAEAKKRGRSKKPVPEKAVTRPAMQTKTSSAQKPSGKVVASKTAKPVEVNQSKKPPTVAKSSSSKPTVTTKQDAAVAAPTQPTPMPRLGGSKIIDEVRATGTLGRIQSIEDEWAAIAAAQKTAAAQVQEEMARMRLRSRSGAVATALSSHSNHTPNSDQRRTTIPLPRVPKPAPSPLTPLPSSNVKPAPPGYHYRAPPPPPSPSPSPSPSPPKPYTPPTRPHTRIIEPTPNMELPPKYRPAARRVTAIIVGLPFVIVMGWELFERWNGKEVKKRFGDEGLPGPKLASQKRGVE